MPVFEGDIAHTGIQRNPNECQQRITNSMQQQIQMPTGIFKGQIQLNFFNNIKQYFIMNYRILGLHGIMFELLNNFRATTM